jgi:hypothetical protein
VRRKAVNDKKAMNDEIERQEIPAVEFADELVDEALDRTNERCHCVGGTHYCVWPLHLIRRRAMTEKIEQQEQDTSEFADELSDEALDRTTGNGAPFCCAFCQS